MDPDPFAVDFIPDQPVEYHDGDKPYNSLILPEAVSCQSKHQQLISLESGTSFGLPDAPVILFDATDNFGESFLTLDSSYRIQDPHKFTAMSHEADELFAPAGTWSENASCLAIDPSFLTTDATFTNGPSSTNALPTVHCERLLPLHGITADALPLPASCDAQMSSLELGIGTHDNNDQAVITTQKLYDPLPNITFPLSPSGNISGSDIFHSPFIPSNPCVEYPLFAPMNDMFPSNTPSLDIYTSSALNPSIHSHSNFLPSDFSRLKELELQAESLQGLEINPVSPRTALIEPDAMLAEEMYATTTSMVGHDLLSSELQSETIRQGSAPSASWSTYQHPRRLSKMVSSRHSNNISQSQNAFQSVFPLDESANETSRKPKRRYTLHYMLLNSEGE